MNTLQRIIAQRGGMAELRAGRALRVERGAHVLEIEHTDPENAAAADMLRVVQSRMNGGRLESAVEALFHVCEGRWEPHYWRADNRERFVFLAVEPGHIRIDLELQRRLTEEAGRWDRGLAALGFAAKKRPASSGGPATLSRILRRGGGVKGLRERGPIRIVRGALALEIEHVGECGRAHMIGVALGPSRGGRSAPCTEALFSLRGGEWRPECWRDERGERSVNERINERLFLINLELQRELTGSVRKLDARIKRLGFADGDADYFPLFASDEREEGRA